uniref:Triatin-like salivary lipocalin n=1 Tax=Triatoma infestans TaxID=30076 RepID=A6YPN9_TRIIF|nr:triatin-like salivary lipocalin [Triatoma infestans]
MKTIITLIFFGVLTYASEEKQKIQYGQSNCQGYRSMQNFTQTQFFQGKWSLTHSTPSTRVTASTICRDYEVTVHQNGTIQVTYGYNENECGNHYDVHCNGTENSDTKGVFNFDCHLYNGMEESQNTHIDVAFLATDYDNYCVVYRCVKIDENFVEDNVFILYRPGKTNEDYAKTLAEHYGLTIDNFISRKNASCTSR